MAHWIGAQGQLKWVKNSKNLPYSWRHQGKTPHPNQIIFLQSNIKRLAESVDGLNSFLAQSF